VSVVEHTLPDLLSDAEERKDLAKSANSEAAVVEVLAETICENDPASSPELCDDIMKDGGLSR